MTRDIIGQQNYCRRCEDGPCYRNFSKKGRMVIGLFGIRKSSVFIKVPIERCPNFRNGDQRAQAKRPL